MLLAFAFAFDSTTRSSSMTLRSLAYALAMGVFALHVCVAISGCGGLIDESARDAGPDVHAIPPADDPGGDTTSGDDPRHPDYDASVDWPDTSVPTRRDAGPPPPPPPDASTTYPA